MRQIAIDFKTSPIEAGYLGEHNATEIVVAKPSDLSGLQFSVAFQTNGEVIHSKYFSADEEIRVSLWQQLTQDNVLGVQLESYDENGAYIGKSATVRLLLKNSVHGTDVVADADNPDVYSEIAQNSSFRETLEDNLNTLDKLTTSETGKLLFDGKLIEGSGCGSGGGEVSSELIEQIEANTEARHIHTNKATLDRLGVSAENVLTFDGKEVGTEGGGSGGAVNVSALAPQIVATLLTTSRTPAVFEEPDVASMDTSQFFEKLSRLPDADSMLIYAPGKRGTLQVFDVGFDYSLYGLTVEESGLYVFKCDIPNGGMMQVATAYGETVRQALIQGVESLTFNYLSEVGTLIE